jgi:hypothetical protein
VVRIKHAQADRGWDFYQTPPEATRALLRAERLPHGIWEPHCGLGAIAEVLLDADHAVYCSDVKNRGYPMQAWTGDFLELDRCPPGVEAMVMNPPFESAAIHIRHGMKICPMVCALLRLTFLEAGQEKTEAGRARIFCMDSFPPARVHVFRERLPMMHREGWTGPRSSSTTAYAWFVWDGDHDGQTTIDRISWD